jgi:hypothetical protein
MEATANSAVSHVMPRLTRHGDGAARQVRDARHGRHSTPPGGSRFARRKQTTTSLVPFRTVRFPTLPNRPPINHANAASAKRLAEESQKVAWPLAANSD